LATVKRLAERLVARNVYRFLDRTRTVAVYAVDDILIREGRVLVRALDFPIQRIVSDNSRAGSSVKRRRNGV
jgi:hypothetical protein